MKPDKTKDTLSSTSFIKILVSRGDTVADFSGSTDEKADAPPTVETPSNVQDV
ncbi:MAG: hypothetical protein R3F39_18675 [Myxococcota bacterium]